MDSLRITLLIIGAIFIALVYAWERFKRRKDHNRYARWGVSDDSSETHIIGGHSGDPETDSRLVATAYEAEVDPEIDSAEQYQPDVDVNDYVDEQDTTEDPDLIEDDEPEEVLSETDSWQAEVEASLAEDEPEFEPDLDSDPETNVNQIDDITSELEALEEIISSDSESNQMEIGDLDIPFEQTSNQPDRIIAVHVLAREGASFSGADILSSLMHLGMQYGDMNIFHRLDDNERSIFSLANAIEPGVFDLAAMDEMTTPALLLMMSLPNSLPALEAFDLMLETARSLAASLDGRLCDDRRSVLTRQAIDELRSELSSL